MEESVARENLRSALHPPLRMSSALPTAPYYRVTLPDLETSMRTGGRTKKPERELSPRVQGDKRASYQSF